MTKPLSATERGLAPHWKVRVVIPGSVIHLASTTEPRVDFRVDGVVQLAQIQSVTATWIEDHRYGDTVGFIDWSEVRAITWRWAE